MDEQQALRIVTSLANGVDPETGEVFPESSPYQRATTIRALFKAQRIMEDAATANANSPPAQRNQQPRPNQTDSQARSEGGSKGADEQRKKNPAMANAGKPWSTEEDRQLLAMFDADTALADIARAHGRTIGGVRARLEKHGRLEPSPATRWPSSANTAAN